MDSELGLLLLLGLIIAAHVRIGDLKSRLDALDPKRKKEKLSLPVAKSTRLPRETKQKSKPSPFLKWISTDWPMKIGAFLLLLAFGWLTTYAFINNWIGPMGRIGLGVGAGLLILALGEWRIRKYAGQGAVFTALGAATILVSLFAARNVYDFFTPLSALLEMFAVVAFMGVSSLRHKNLALSIVGLLMGALAPLLVNAPTVNYPGLFSYLFVLTIGALLVTVKSQWRVLSLLSLLVVFFYSGLTLLPESDKSIALIFAGIFTVLFYLSNGYFLWTSKRPKSLDVDTSIAVINGLLLIGWGNETLLEEWRGPAMIGVALALFILTYFHYRRLGQDKVLLAYGLTGAVCLGIGTIAELEGAKLTLALTWEAVGLIALAGLVTKDPKVSLKLSPLLLAGIASGLESYNTRLWEYNLLSLHALALYSQIILLLGMSVYFHKKTSLFFIFLGLGGVQAIGVILLAANIFHPAVVEMNLIFMAAMTALILLLSALFKDRRVNRLLPLLLAPSLVMNLESYAASSSWANGIWHLDFAALLSFVVILLGLGMVFQYFKEKWALWFYVLCGIHAMVLVWLSSDALIQNPSLHITVSLGVYTLAGLFFNLQGVLKNNKVSRIAGGILIGLVVARLLLVDVWEMTVGAKVITFFIIGALLISTAFFNKKLRPSQTKKKTR